jgi:hypothetical protein
VRTSDAKGAEGLSMLLIEKSEQVVVRKIPTVSGLKAVGSFCCMLFLLLLLVLL